MNDAWPARILFWFRSNPRRGDVAVAGIAAVMGTLLIVGGSDHTGSRAPELLSGVAVFVVVLVRRRSPKVLLVGALAVFVAYALIVGRPTPLIFAVLVLLVTVCIRLDRQRSIAVGLVVGALLYLLAMLVTDTNYADARAVIAIAWTAGAVGIADAIRSWRDYRISVDEQARSALVAAEAQARHQVSEERLEIARELHDLLAHNLSVMNVQAGAALHLLRSDPDSAEQSLITARDAGRSVFDELREVLVVLRRDEAGGVEPTTSLPTVDELDVLIDTMRASGLNVTWTAGGTPRTLAPATSLAAYRITQEALTNAAKHGAGSVDLTTEWSESGFTIRTSNESRDATPFSTGLGLTGMHERAIANGGKIIAEPVGDLFNIEVWLPIAHSQETST